MSIDKSEGETATAERKLLSLIDEQEAKLAEITDLVTHVRHEINNPLTGVIGQAQLLLREELSASARRRIETIEELASRIKDAVGLLRKVQRSHPHRKQTKTEEPQETRYGESKVKS